MRDAMDWRRGWDSNHNYLILKSFFR